MGEPRIKFGMNPQGQLVHILEAKQYTHYYTCPDCEDYLQVRQGEERIWYFAHLKSEESTSRSRSCDLRSPIGLEQWTERVRKSPIERAESARRMRLFVLRHPYTNALSLGGVLPVIPTEELAGLDDISSVVSSLRFETLGLRETPEAAQFHPSEAEVMLDLDPNAKEYRVVVSSSYSLPRLVGNWTANQLTAGVTFVGSDQRAEMQSAGARVKDADTVFVILEKAPPEIPPGVTLGKLSKWNVAWFNFNARTEAFLRTYAPALSRDTNAFYVDVVLPESADPQPWAPVDGEPGTLAVLAVIPAHDLNPDFEVVSVPLSAQSTSIIPASVEGQPRLFVEEFPPTGSRRLSIHWGGRHISVVLHSSIEPTDDSGRESSRAEGRIGLRISLGGGEETELHPWDNPDFQMKVERGRVVEGPEMIVVGPPDLPIDLTGRFYSGPRPSSTIRERLKTAEVPGRIRSWLQREGLDSVYLSYGSLGSIRIEPGRAERTFRSLPAEEIERRLRKMGQGAFSESINVLVREVYDAPGGTLHHCFPPGTRKRVRRILSQLKKQDKKANS